MVDLIIPDPVIRTIGALIAGLGIIQAKQILLPEGTSLAAAVGLVALGSVLTLITRGDPP